MADIVTLAMAAQHLRIAEPTGSPLTGEGQDLQRKIDQATEVVRDYIARPSDADWTAEMAAWTENTVPASVQAAILMQVAELWRYRGDDDEKDSPARPQGGDDLSPGVKNLLKRYRDPVLA